MKTAEQFQTALTVKESQLAEVTKKIADVDAWVEANNAFGTSNDHAFLEKLLTEKVDLRTRQIQLQAQVDFLKWGLQ